MSPYFATHAGLLRYVAKDFEDMARTAGDQSERLRVYASILERMVNELAPNATPVQSPATQG